MRQIGFWAFTSLVFPFATALAAPGASSVPDEIQGHPYKRLIGSLIEVEGWKGFMPQSKVFHVWKRKPVDDWFHRDIWLATTVGHTEPDLKTALTLADDTYKNISTEADRYQFDCNRNRARVIDRVRTSGPFKTGEVVFRSTAAKELPFAVNGFHLIPIAYTDNGYCQSLIPNIWRQKSKFYGKKPAAERDVSITRMDGLAFLKGREEKGDSFIRDSERPLALPSSFYITIYFSLANKN